MISENRYKNVFVIAELGINHDGSTLKFLDMVKSAVAAGANGVKIQLADPSESYHSKTDSYSIFKSKDLPDDILLEGKEYADKNGVEFFGTPGDFKSLDRLCKLGVNLIKISSGLMSNYPLIKEISNRGVSVIISTGMANYEEVDDLVNIFVGNSVTDIALLKCTSLYPSPDQDIKLSEIKKMIERYRFPIGYSDHTLDDLACVSSIALGAKIIEKHFTLNKKSLGGDHFLSAEPFEFLQMVNKIRRVEAMLVSGGDLSSESELLMRSQRYRCVVASRLIQKGEKINLGNVYFKRLPANLKGFEAKNFHILDGRVLNKEIYLDEPIFIEDTL
jgi:N,N'-diacetyllegionaminate synthase